MEKKKIIKRKTEIIDEEVTNEIVDAWTAKVKEILDKKI